MIIYALSKIVENYLGRDAQLAYTGGYDFRQQEKSGIEKGLEQISVFMAKKPKNGKNIKRHYKNNDKAVTVPVGTGNTKRIEPRQKKPDETWVQCVRRLTGVNSKIASKAVKNSR